jgi:uncharacterized protein (TIGR02145 family)
MKVRFLPFLMLPILGMAQANSNGEVPLDRNTSSEKQTLEIKRNASFNLDVIKVRWKKAALENCTGVPCVVEPPAPSFTCGTSTISDVDNNVYETVSIGNQCWTKQNLKVTRYNDSSPIDFDNSGGAMGFSFTPPEYWSTRNSGAYTIYANESSTGTNATNYGFLYNWYAAVGIVTPMGSTTKNICPSGWHVPTDGEWATLETQLGGSSVAGSKMKSTGNTFWSSLNLDADNTSGFSALPGGFRFGNAFFGFISTAAFFWSATENIGDAWYRDLNHFNTELRRFSGIKAQGSSIRCLKD